MRPAVIVGILLTGLPLPARGDGAERTTIQAPPNKATSSQTLSTDDAFVGLGGGDFLGDLGKFTVGGVGWSARLNFNAYRFFGLELFYQGINCALRNVTLSNGASTEGTGLIQHEITFDLKGTWPINVADRTLEPYLFAGFGWSHISAEVLFSPDGTTISNSSVFPVGVGASFIFKNNFALDGRFTYNLLVGNRTAQIHSGDYWLATMSIGYRVRSLF
jgi:hypothetical protein